MNEITIALDHDIYCRMVDIADRTNRPIEFVAQQAATIGLATIHEALELFDAMRTDVPNCEHR